MLPQTADQRAQQLTVRNDVDRRIDPLAGDPLVHPPRVVASQLRDKSLAATSPAADARGGSLRNQRSAGLRARRAISARRSSTPSGERRSVASRVLALRTDSRAHRRVAATSGASHPGRATGVGTPTVLRSPARIGSRCVLTRAHVEPFGLRPNGATPFAA
jgi:hypothetical protein